MDFSCVFSRSNNPPPPPVNPPSNNKGGGVIRNLSASVANQDSRRASHAGFPLHFLCFNKFSPKAFPARLARRIPSVLHLLSMKCPQNSPGALRAPDYLIPHCFSAFGPQIPQNPPGALRVARRIPHKPSSARFACRMSFVFPYYWTPTFLLQVKRSRK